MSAQMDLADRQANNAINQAPSRCSGFLLLFFHHSELRIPQLTCHMHEGWVRGHVSIPPTLDTTWSDSFSCCFPFPTENRKEAKKEGAPPLSAPQVLTAINSNAGSALPATATPPDSRAYVSVGVTVDQSMKNAFASFGFSCSLFCCGK